LATLWFYVLVVLIVGDVNLKQCSTHHAVV